METAQATSTGFSTILTENKNQMAKIREFEAQPITTKARNLAFVGVVIGCVFLTGLFALQIIKGTIALLFVFIFFIAMYYGLKLLRQMDPVIYQKIKNKKLELMYGEARKNAIYQLDNQVITNAQRLEAARTSRNEVGGMVRELENEVKRSDPNGMYHAGKVEMFNTLKKACDTICANIDRAALAFDSFERKVNEFKTMDKFTQKVSKAMGILGGMGMDKMEERLSLVAFEAIEGDFNTAICAIENATRDASLLPA
jgi:hypothetical protein